MKQIIVFIFLSISFFNMLHAQKVENSDTVASKVESKEVTPAFIEVSSIPQRAAELTTELKEILSKIEKEDSTNMESEIEPYCDSITALLDTSKYKNTTEYNVREFQKIQSELAVYHKKLQEWENILQSKIKIYDTHKEALKKHKLTWDETEKNAQKEDVPEAISTQIKTTILSIKELENDIKVKYDETLTLSQIVTSKVLVLDEMSLELKKSEQEATKKIFIQNELTFLNLFSKNNFALLSYLKSIKTSAFEKFAEIQGYFDAHRDLYLRFYIFIIISSFVVLYAYYHYRKRTLFINHESYDKKEYFFIKNIFSTLILVYILSMVSVFPDRPNTISEVVMLVMLIPVMQILQTIVEKRFNKYIYTFFILYILYIFNKNSTGYELENRLFLLLINISLVWYFTHILLRKSLDFIRHTQLIKILKYIVSISIFLLVLSIGSNLYGSVLLSYRILDIVFMFFYATATFYVLHTILRGYVVIALRRRISTASYMLEKYSQNIETTIKFLIKIWMFLWWAFIISRLLGVYPIFVKIMDNILALSWSIADTVISVQSIVDFMLIVFATWAIAKFIKVILEVEVFARFKFPRGAPTAILTVLNYVIVISGTIISFSSLGVSSQQFAIIFGALGVGIGFGLRNIIANFVSGIIMVFERPVQLGDVIEVGNTMGSVQSIGARASTLQTFDGSEVIIPNADFIGKEIVNWTLSDERRRKTLEFKVDLDNDIDKVLKVMSDIAKAHPDVLKDPKPIATFKGFGEYSLDFKLYFWLSDNLIVAQSEIAIEVYKTLQKEGVSMPVPKTHFKGDFK